MSDNKQDTTVGVKYRPSEDIRAALPNILGRNFSHNIGSHKFNRTSSTQLSEEATALFNIAAAQEFLMSATVQVTEEEANHLIEEANVRLNKLMDELSKETKTPVPTSDSYSEQPPPAAAEYFLRLVIEEKDREIVLGDLFEKYERAIEKQGKRRADLWLYYELARSVWPLFRQFVARVSGRIVRTRRAE